MKLSTAKKIHPETGGWFLEAYSVITNFHAKVTDLIAKGTNSIAKWTNSIAKATNSIAKTCSKNGRKNYYTVLRRVKGNLGDVM